MASTYVNNLRLEEIGSGEQSGTWGDTTNTNLEIIGQAVAWGTRAIANASTDNITIADGALDADRCLGLKLTGGGQACTVTLLPNTSSKTWFMYNATAAALTFTCGSGANVIIPAGQTKVIATDGLGSGGVVHDLLTAVNLAGATVVDDLTVSDDLTVTDDLTVGGDIDLEGSIDVNGTTNLDIVDIDGAVDMATTLAVAGNVDFNGDLDVDGTTNLDVVDIDGAVDMATTALVTGVLTANGGVVFNEGSADVDFRVESNGATNALLVDGGNNHVNIMTSTDLGAVLNVSGNAYIQHADNSDTLTLESTDADANNGPNLMLYRSSANPADGDRISSITYRGRNDNSQDVDYIVYDSFITDASDGVESGELDIRTMVAGTETTRILLDPAETVFNEASADLDFRVETNGVTDALFVDGGNNNVQIGTGADFVTNTAGTSNFRAGVNAGNSIASGGDKNVVVGDEAGTAITTGDQNTFVGYAAGDATTTSSNNTGIGNNALGGNILGSYNVAIGKDSLEEMNPATAVNMYNTAVGAAAGQKVTTGVENNLIGGLAGDALTTGSYNQVLGVAALSADTLGSRSVAIGHAALFSQNFTTATDVYNVAVGHNAGLGITTGIQNTLIGSLAGDAFTDADKNTAVGTNALSSDTLGSKSVAVGTAALFTQNFTTATDSYNTAVGFEAGKATTTGINNTLIGGLAGDALTDADYNTAIGYAALSGDTLGSRSTALGYGTLINQNFTTATNTYNTAVGYYAGVSVTTGAENTIIGGQAGDTVTTGSGNVIIGYVAGTNDINFATGDNNVIIGALADVTATDATGANVIGRNVSGEAGYTTLGSGGDDIRAEHGVATWATVSDQRYKKDIVDSTAGLSFINALQPRTFKYKTLGELPETFRAYEADSTDVFKNSNTNHGFIAQEVKAAIDADSSIKDGFKLWDDREDGSQEVAEAALIPVLTKAVQELSTALDAALARIATLEG